MDGSAYGGVNSLRNIPAAQVAIIRFYRGFEAEILQRRQSTQPHARVIPADGHVSIRLEHGRRAEHRVHILVVVELPVDLPGVAIEAEDGAV